jgi:hypothetical protein
MKNKVKIFFSVLAIILMISCAKDEGPFVRVSTSNTNKPNDSIKIIEPTVLPFTIRFNDHIKPIFRSNCIQGCHSPSHPKLDLRPPVAYNQLLTLGKSAPYVNPAEPKKSILYLHLVGIRLPMPKDKPKLSQATIDTVYTWISQGAANN